MLATFASGACAHADPVRVERLRFGAEDGRTRVVIDTDRPIADYNVFALPDDGARVVVDLERAAFALDGRATADGQRAGAGQGLVAAYRYADFSEQRSRIVLDLAAPARIAGQFQLDPPPNSAFYRLVLDLEPAPASAPRTPPASAQGRQAEAPRAATPAPAADGGRGEDSFVIVLDPGHGGSQPGARGGDGLVEKDVTLDIALALRDLLEASGRYRVVMTRDSDRTVELDERVRIAREAGGDLLLSIHADALEGDDGVRGASVYTLADYAEHRSRDEILAEAPWILGVDLERQREEVSDILIIMEQRDTRNRSSAFAEALLPRLREADIRLVRNSHRSKGFYVLLAPDVPSVLLEAGFLSNRDDEALLASERHRDKLARAMASAIDDHFDEREQLYAAR